MEMTARNPLTGVEDYRFRVDSREDVRRAVERVRAAQAGWNALGVEGRAAALRRLWDAFEREKPALLAALCADTGRERIAHIEIGAVKQYVEFAIANAREVLAPQTERPTAIPGVVGSQQLVPYGVVGVIAPWNFPVVLSMVDAIPALMSGCGVVLKPSEVTPRYAEPLAAIFASVPQLADVFAIVRGPGGTGADLVDHCDAIVLTGSVRTGRVVAEQAARRFIPAFLELGGNDAVIVTHDADLERAAMVCVRAAVAATGQACQSVERVYVDRRVHDRFLKRVCEVAGQLTLTCDDPAGHIGPFIMSRQADIVREQIDEAVSQGARVECGGRIIERGGRWCEVTVLSSVTHRMRVMRDETFGPVLPVMAFDTIEQAIALANDTEYGLSANVFAATEAEARAIGERLEAGFVSLNDASMSSMVFDVEWEGFKLSGLGRSRMGRSGVARYLRVKAIVANRGPVADISFMRNR